jgi:hypothetical protein
MNIEHLLATVLMGGSPKTLTPVQPQGPRVSAPPVGGGGGGGGGMEGFAGLADGLMSYLEKDEEVAETPGMDTGGDWTFDPATDMPPSPGEVNRPRPRPKFIVDENGTIHTGASLAPGGVTLRPDGSIDRRASEDTRFAPSPYGLTMPTALGSPQPIPQQPPQGGNPLGLPSQGGQGGGLQGGGGNGMVTPQGTDPFNTDKIGALLRMFLS